ncbi:MAG TPA: chromate efflux transporter [Chthoniobacterales bacterium]
MPSRRSRPVEVFTAFLRLGLTSFGGPVAHLGFFRTEFVERRRWLDDEAFADLVALGQLLPGPASSQVGIALGHLRAGLAGALAAWAGFTLPSAALMMACAYGLGTTDLAPGWLHGLKLAAVAVVAQAVWQMGRQLCPDVPRATLALAAAALALVAPTPWMQLGLIILGLLLGAQKFRPAPPPVAASQPDHLHVRPSPWSATCLGLFFALLGGLPLLALAWPNHWLDLANGFYRSGALVFGGGHVILPLLQAETVGHGWIHREDFLAGYGAAQALPGPLFSFAAYLGVFAGPGWLGGLWCLAAIYLPSFLLVFAALPHWQTLRSRPGARGALAGANAAVVGLLLATLLHPVATSALDSWPAAGLALAAWAALQFGKIPPWLLVIACALAGRIILS